MADPPAAPARPRLLNRPLWCLMVASLGGAASFFGLLPVVPLYVTAGGAGEAGAGATTSAMLIATVVAELATPRLAARFGHRAVFAAGLVLMGAPALALPLSDQLTPVVAVSAVRGLGFGIVVVLGSALVGTIVPPSRRGEGFGVYGVVIGIPGVLVMPLGVFLSGQVGFPPVLVAGGAAALVGLVAVTGLPGRRSGPADPAEDRPMTIVAVLRSPALLRPALVLGACATAAGAVVTFVPLAVAAGSGAAWGGLAALALLAQAAVATYTRWWAGRNGDRRGSGRLLAPAVLAAGAGTLLLVLVPNPVAVLAGMVLFGAGYGVGQNASLALMFSRVRPAGYGAASAVWNIAFDLGLAVGAAAAGVVAARAGYPAAFTVIALVVLATLAPAWRDRGCGRRRYACRP